MYILLKFSLKTTKHYIVCSYELMCKCWEEEPTNRPTFSDISEFLGKLLNGETKPETGSDEAAGYIYAREATKHIPEDYLNVNTIIENDDYIVPVATTPIGPAPTIPSNTSTPTPAEGIHVTTADVVNNDYVNNPQPLND